MLQTLCHAGSNGDYEQANVGLSNTAVMPLGLTVKCVTARTVTNVPSVPFTRTWLVEVVTKIRLVVVSLNAKVSCPGRRPRPDHQV